MHPIMESPLKDLGRDQMMAQPVLTDWMAQEASGEAVLQQYREYVSARRLPAELQVPEAMQTMDAEISDMYANALLACDLLRARSLLGNRECKAKLATAGLHERPALVARMQRLDKAYEVIQSAINTTEKQAITMHTTVAEQLHRLGEAHRTGQESPMPRDYLEAYRTIERQCGELSASLNLLRSTVERDRSREPFTDEIDKHVTHFCVETLLPRSYNLAKRVATESITLPLHWPGEDGNPVWKHVDAEKKLLPAPERRKGFQMTAGAVKAALAENPQVADLAAFRAKSHGV